MNLAELLKQTGIADDDEFSFMDMEEPAPPPPPQPTPPAPQVQIQMEQAIPAVETKENNVSLREIGLNLYFNSKMICFQYFLHCR